MEEGLAGSMQNNLLLKLLVSFILRQRLRTPFMVALYIPREL